MGVSALVLWIHVLSGVVWVGACASFVLAASAMAAGGELRDFATRAAARINRLNLVVACAIPLTGLGNLYFVGERRGFVFSTPFVAILSVKLVLFTVMAVGLAGAWRIAATLPTATATDQAIRRLTRLYGMIAALGTVALGLGLWLSGTR